MKKLNFGEMEIINGGQSLYTAGSTSATISGQQTVYSPLDPVGVDGKNCAGKGALVFLSAIVSFGTTGLTAGIS
ncbi:hypothetical protein FACS189463_0790 [Bacteroidia bacterium]|nr:hypothetical protein FACS189463_0790 [Bacteroidia bacterium]